MIDRLIPKYPTFLVLGLVIVASGLFMMTAARDILIGVWADRLFSGDTDGDLFKATQTADEVIGHTLTVWFFLGLSFLKLGIGFAIATIVRNLRATGQRVEAAYDAAGVSGAQETHWEEPWYGRLFPKFLFAGILVMVSFFLVTLWWDVNLVFLKDAEFDGRTGASYQAFLMIDRVLEPLINAGKFLGEGLLILGIMTGLATIIWNLSLQSRRLPWLTRRAFANGETPKDASEIRPVVPNLLVGLGIGEFALMALATPLALFRAGAIGWSLGREFEGTVAETAIRLDGILGRTIDPLINMGLGLLLFTIAFLLLTIIFWLRQQRSNFGEAVADLSNGAVPRPGLEGALWPTRLVAPLAGFGIAVVGIFFFTLTPVRDLNFNSMLTLQFAGAVDGATFQNAFRLDQMLGPVIGATRFIGIAALMLAIGLALVTIVINLRATALLLPTGFSKLLAVAGGEPAEPEDLTIHEPMSLAPWDLFRPLVAGAIVVVTATLPIAILFALSIHWMLEQQFAGLGVAGSFLATFEDSFLAVRIFAATTQAWMLFGMGIIFFAIGRFFTTIVGFVEARRMIITEGSEAIAEATAARRMEEVGVPAD